MQEMNRAPSATHGKKFLTTVLKTRPDAVFSDIYSSKHTKQFLPTPFCHEIPMQ